MREHLHHTGSLVRFMLKREAVVSTVWILILVLFSAALAPGMSGMFDTDSRQQFAQTFNNPVMIAMMGPVYGADHYTQGAMYSNMMLLWILIAVAVMNIFLVSRHTRADEEKGRAELARSLPTGRLALLNAAMITAFIVNAALGILMGLGIGATGVETMGMGGSMLYGAVVFATGLVFASITAVFCQLTSGRSGATGYAFAAMGLFYMVRAAGDMAGGGFLSCISPLGLAQRAQVYVQNRLWPVFALLLESAVIAAAAYKLNEIRDLGQGLIPARPGRKDASVYLRSPFGLALRLLRNTLIIWIAAMFSLGASYGSVIGDISAFVGDSPQYLEMLGMPAAYAASLTDAMKTEAVQTYFLSFVTTMMTLIGLVPLLLIALKPRNEEKERRAEQVLSRPIPRMKYLSGYTILAYTASILLPLMMATGIYLSAASLAGSQNPFTLGVLIKANLAYMPAAWVMIGAVVLLTGVFPKVTGAVWGYYGFICFTSFIGAVIGLPDWLLGLSPMKHVPQVLLTEMNYPPLIIMSLIAAALTVTGFIFYKRRDLVNE